MKPTTIRKSLTIRFLNTSGIALLALTGIACDGTGPTIVLPATVSTEQVVQDDNPTPPPIATVTGDSTSVITGADTPVVTPAAEAAVIPAPVNSTGVASRPLSQEAQDLLTSAEGSGSIRIMQVGDSITHGTKDSDSYRKEFASLMAGAGCRINTVGSQSATFHQSGYYAAHEGYSGHTADDFINGHTTSSGENLGISHAVSYQKPDVVLLHLGSVDIFVGQTVESTVADVDQVIATIFDTKPDTLVLVANIIPWYSTDAGISVPASIKSLGTEIEQIVRESANPLLALVDVRSGYTEDMMQRDLIHPAEAGDKHIAEAFYDRISAADACQ